MQLNIVFIKETTFPHGYAMTKRHRYIVDYLNEEQITSGLIQTRYKPQKFKNPDEGVYGLARYCNAGHFWYRGVKGKLHYFSKVFNCLRKYRINGKQNVLVFSTLVRLDEIPFYLYAKFLGYKISFDIVENFLTEGSGSSKMLQLSFKFSHYAYKKAHALFVISSQLKEVITHIAPNVPICLLPNSAPVLRENKKTSFAQPIRILYSGTFAEKDGIQYLLEGYTQFAAETETASELLLTGGSSKMQTPQINELISNYSPNIKYLGFLSDDALEDLVAKSDILTMTRCNSGFANFGFPFKLSEYLASGNTVLATRVGDVPSYITHLENAYLVEPENSASITEAFHYLVNHEKEAISIGKCGGTVVNQYFDVKKNGKIFIEHLSTKWH